jgi:hypothetical protein
MNLCIFCKEETETSICKKCIEEIDTKEGIELAKENK